MAPSALNPVESSTFNSILMPPKGFGVAPSYSIPLTPKDQYLTGPPNATLSSYTLLVPPD